MLQQLRPPLILPFLFLLGFSVQGLSEAVYKVVDENGNITYTDQPQAPSALKPVKLPPINPVSSPPIKPAANSSLEPSTETGGTAQAHNAGEPVGYSRAVILSPRNNQLILHNQVNLIIQLGLEPQLQAGHQIQFWHNGQPLGLPVQATAYQLDNIERGAHRLGATVLDARGRSLIRATPVKIHVKRHFKRPAISVQPSPK